MQNSESVVILNGQQVRPSGQYLVSTCRMIVLGTVVKEGATITIPEIQNVTILLDHVSQFLAVPIPTDLSQLHEQLFFPPVHVYFPAQICQ